MTARLFTGASSECKLEVSRHTTGNDQRIL